MTMIPNAKSNPGAARRGWIVRGSHGRLAAGMLALACSWSGLATLTTATANASPRIVTTATASASPRIAPERQLAVLLYQHEAYRSPRTTAPPIASIAARRPLTGEQTTLPVVRQTRSRGKVRWLQVMLPGRPNGSTVWIHRGGTRETLTPWHIVVSTSAARVWVYFQGRVSRSFPAVVGKPSTPTPTGSFFVEETVTMPATMPGGPFAVALSARSDVLQEFDGGPGQIAIHGRDGLGGDLGQAESHGCMRLDTAAIDWLAARIGPGVPVDIHSRRVPGLTPPTSHHSGRPNRPEGLKSP